MKSCIPHCVNMSGGIQKQQKGMRKRNFLQLWGWGNRFCCCGCYLFHLNVYEEGNLQGIKELAQKIFPKPYWISNQTQKAISQLCSFSLLLSGNRKEQIFILYLNIYSVPGTLQRLSYLIHSRIQGDRYWIFMLYG